MRRGGLVLLLLVAIGGFFYFGGSAEGPENVPQPPEAPSANEAAGGVASFFNTVADTVSGWGPMTWRILAVFTLVGLGIWMFRKVPMAVWLVAAVVGLVVAVAA